MSEITPGRAYAHALVIERAETKQYGEEVLV